MEMWSEWWSRHTQPLPPEELCPLSTGFAFQQRCLQSTSRIRPSTMTREGCVSGGIPTTFEWVAVLGSVILGSWGRFRGWPPRGALKNASLCPSPRIAPFSFLALFYWRVCRAKMVFFRVVCPSRILLLSSRGYVFGVTLKVVFSSPQLLWHKSFRPG